MTSPAGRRSGRTRLRLKHVEARHRAITKLEAREDAAHWRLVNAAHVAVFGTLPAQRPGIELPGHHLQRAAAENA